MNAAEIEGWQRTSPLAAIFFLGKIYRAIAQNAIQYLAPLVAFLFAYEGNLIGKVVFGIGAFVSVTVSAAFVRYWFFRYRISDNSVLIRDGVINKTQLDIKFDRIQAISTQQNIVFRSFGLITIKLDTAGSAGQEGHLPAVGLKLSETLKERIRQESPVKTPTADSDGEAAGDASIRKIMQLGARDMIRIGLSSNRALIFLAFLAPVVQQFDAAIEENIDKETLVTAAQGVQAGDAAGVGFVAIIVIGFLLLLVSVPIIGAFLRYHRFTLVADNEVLRSTAGLLTRHEHSVNLNKIQSLVATQNVIQRLFKRFRLQARQASSGKAAHLDGQHFVVPLCGPEQLPLLSDEVFGEEFPGVALAPDAAAFLPIAKDYVWPRIMLTGIAPASAFTALILTKLEPVALIFPLIWLPVSALVVWRHYKRYGVLVTPDGMVLRRGFLGFRITAFLHRKVQRISVTQTLLQKRKGLVTLRFYLASGSVRIPYVDAVLARKLRDHVLYRVESSQLAWH